MVPKAVPVALPASFAFDAATRAELDELAAVEDKHSMQERCSDRTDGTICLRALLFRDPEEARMLLTARPPGDFCECSAEPALLAALGPRVLVPLLRHAAERGPTSSRVRPADALDLVESLDTPMALAIVLPFLLGPPTYETHHDESRDRRARARRWLRGAGAETRALVRRIAGGEVPEALVGIASEHCRSDAVDAFPNLPTCARAALRVLGEGDEPVLLPIQSVPDDVWPPDLELDGRRLTDDARATLVGWLLRTEWCLPANPGLLLADACSASSRRAIAESFATRWCATEESATELAFVALAFGGVDAARAMLDPDGWVKDPFKPRRTVKQATLYRALGAYASSVSGAARDAILELLAELAIDGRKKSALWRRIALAELERCAAEVGEPKDTLDERHVPTLGFDARGRTELAFGARSLVLALDADLSLVVEDGAKKRASLPTAKKTDDPEAIARAKERFAELRARLRVYSEGAQVRARTWIRQGQCWRRRDFDVVARHPILGAAARGLVFGEYDPERSLLRTFRVAEDRSLATVDDAVLTLADEALVGPVHTGELDEATRTRWASVLHDYEIIPLASQLEAPRALALAPDDPMRLFVAPSTSYWPHKVDDLDPPEGWVPLSDWQLLGEPVPSPLDFVHGSFRRWQRRVRGFQVKIDGRYDGFAALVRRHGDYRLGWLRWDAVPAVVSHEILGDIEEFMPRFA